MRIKLIFFTLLIYMHFSPSYAYFDPGTGMFILQALIALISGFFFYLMNQKLLLKKIKKKIHSLFSKKETKEEEITPEKNEKNKD